MAGVGHFSVFSRAVEDKIPLPTSASVAWATGTNKIRQKFLRSLGSRMATLSSIVYPRIIRTRLSVHITDSHSRNLQLVESRLLKLRLLPKRFRRTAVTQSLANVALFYNSENVGSSSRGEATSGPQWTAAGPDISQVLRRLRGHGFSVKRHCERPLGSSW